MSEDRTWLRMPAVASETAATRTKYSIDADALIIYRGDSAYLGVADVAALKPLLQHSDVRVLDHREAEQFEQGLPFALPPSDEGTNETLRLGDAISAVTKLLRIRECRGCRKRRSRLNQIVLWRW